MIEQLVNISAFWLIIPISNYECTVLFYFIFTSSDHIFSISFANILILPLKVFVFRQTFRSYRELFEEQKSAIDQRYRRLLEDSIQDAVFLSSRNSELTQENQDLKQRKSVGLFVYNRDVRFGPPLDQINT